MSKACFGFGHVKAYRHVLVTSPGVNLESESCLGQVNPVSAFLVFFLHRSSGCLVFFLLLSIRIMVSPAVGDGFRCAKLNERTGPKVLEISLLFSEPQAKFAEATCISCQLSFFIFLLLLLVYGGFGFPAFVGLWGSNLPAKVPLLLR